MTAGIALMLMATARWKLRYPRPGLLRLLTALVGIGLAVGSTLVVGHTRIYQPTWLVMGVDALHALAASVWFGGLVALIVYLRRTAPRRSDVRAPAEVQDAATVVGCFSMMAGWTVAGLAVSGTGLAVIILGSWQALWETNYGRTFLVKLGLAGVVGVLAWWNHSRLLPAVQKRTTDVQQWQRLRRAIIDEAAILTLVVLVTSVLVVQSPAEGGARLPQHAPVATSAFSAPFGPHDVTGKITPAVAGENVIDFTLLDRAGKPIALLELPTLVARLSKPEFGPLTGKVESGSRPGHFRAKLNLPVSGQWDIGISARVSMFEETAAQVAITIP